MELELELKRQEWESYTFNHTWNDTAVTTSTTSLPSHQSIYYKLIKPMSDWCKENDITTVLYKPYKNNIVHVTFYNEEDLLLFKMKWR